MPFILRSSAKKCLGKQAIIHINPKNIQHYADVPFFKESEEFKKRHGKFFSKLRKKIFFLPHALFCPKGDWDKDVEVFSKRFAYKRMLELWENKDNYTLCAWYKEAFKELEKKGKYKHKKELVKNQKELNNLFENYLLKLLHSMKNQGYISHPNEELSRVIISRDGKLLKSRKGRHRFSAAKIVGVTSFPVEIDNIHPRWLEKIDGGFSGEKLQRTKDAILELEKIYSL